jgi:hypothetical protein
MGASLPEYTFEFDAERRVLLITLGKTLTEKGFLQAYIAIQSFVAAEGLCRGITDFSAVETFEISVNFVHQLARRPPAFPIGRPRVVVAPRDDIFGLARMFQLLRDEMNGELHVVRTLDEACALLCIDSPRFTALPIGDSVE